jgi:peptidoglycan/LPS O-acetylase OafA/YrhL
MYTIPSADMSALKIATILVAIPVPFFAYRLRSLGQKLALGDAAFPALMEDKRSTWRCMTGFILAAVILIETMVQFSPHGRQYPVFFPLHLAAALGFAALVLVLRWQTGNKSRLFHRRAGYTALALLLVTIVTGTPLLVQL